MEKQDFYDAVVIGGGPAGLSAGLYLARACYRTLVIEKESFGGQITITAQVVNYPGSGAVSGRELADRMRRQAEDFGCELLNAQVTELDFSGPIRRVITDRGTVECLGVILASGAHPRKVGFAGEEEFQGRGVAYCATCDGEFFRGKEIFVVGGGYAAAEEAVFLTKYASHVTVLIRGEDFSCARTAAREARDNPKITVLTDTVVERVEGDDVLRRIIYRNTKTGERTVCGSDQDTIGVFVFAGYEPSTQLIRGLAQVDEKGYAITDRQQKTSVDGLYAAGDVCVKHLRQAVTAASDGAVAATELEKYLSMMQTRTGRRAKKPVREGAGEVWQAQHTPPNREEGLFDAGMRSQLETVFQRMEQPLTLRLYLDGGETSRQLEKYMRELTQMTDKLSLEKGEGLAADQLPCVQVMRSDGTWSGLAFHGVPGGHEFTSFVLGLYNASGKGQPLDEALKERIRRLDRPAHLTIMVSLSCTMCPELVTAAQKIASLNTGVTTDVYDLNCFPQMREAYHVMSVPCYCLNDSPPMFGKKTVGQLLDILEKA